MEKAMIDQTQAAHSPRVIGLGTVSPAVFRVAAVVAGSLLVALCAHISIPLLFTPVPLTLQTFAVLLLGLTLEPMAAFAALALYLAEGAAGLPVFSPHGPGGILQLFGPTGGYLLSYPFAAFIAASLARRLRPATFTTRVISAAAASLLIFAVGAGWFAALLHQPIGTALKMTVWPFVPGDALKICAAAAVAMGIFKLRNRFFGPDASEHAVL
jgi:biotin transport system substrate-specific component